MLYVQLSFVKEQDVADGPAAAVMNVDPTQQDEPPVTAQIASGIEELGPNSIVDYEIYLVSNPHLILNLILIMLTSSPHLILTSSSSL